MRLDAISTAELRSLTSLLWEIHTSRQELTELLIKDEKGFLDDSPTPFGWANLYNYSILELVLMLLSVLKVGEQIIEEMKEHTSIEGLQSVLDRYEDAEIDDLGLGEEHSQYLFVAIWFALLRSLESIQVYGRPLNLLLQDVANGSDKALLINGVRVNFSFAST